MVIAVRWALTFWLIVYVGFKSHWSVALCFILIALRCEFVDAKIQVLKQDQKQQ